MTTDARTGQPPLGATIAANNSGAWLPDDLNGVCSANLACDGHYVKIEFPGYYSTKLGDGGTRCASGPTHCQGSVLNRVSTYSWYDLIIDPQELHDLGGNDGGYMSKDYSANVKSNATANGGPCPVLPTDNKPAWGFPTVTENNNVRTVVQFVWPMTGGSARAPTACKGLQFVETFSFYRGGRINDRWAIDNTSGVTFAFDMYQYNLNTSWMNFTGECLSSCSPRPNLGYSDGYWNLERDPACAASDKPPYKCYRMATPSPWGFVRTNVNGIPGAYLFHSIVTGTQQDLTGAPITFGSVSYCNYRWCTNPHNETFPVRTEFLRLIKEDAAAGYMAYQGQDAWGLRSKLQVGGSADTQTVIPPNGQESPIKNWLSSASSRHEMLWAGELGIDAGVNMSCTHQPACSVAQSAAAADVFSNEFRNPPTLTMHDGSSQGFNYGGRTTGGGEYDLTADAGPSVDFTTGRVIHSPAFLISRWNNSAPAVYVNGTLQTANVNYVYANPDATHLLVQLVGLPTNGTGGMTTFQSGTRIVISANGSMASQGKRKMS